MIAHPVPLPGKWLPCSCILGSLQPGCSLSLGRGWLIVHRVHLGLDLVLVPVSKLGSYILVPTKMKV